MTETSTSLAVVDIRPPRGGDWDIHESGCGIPGRHQTTEGKFKTLSSNSYLDFCPIQSMGFPMTLEDITKMELFFFRWFPRQYYIAGLAVSSGGRFIPGFFRGFFRPEETISSSFFRKKVEETNLFLEILYYFTKYLLINYL